MELDLSEKEATLLNHKFYSMRPWVYFERRLAHLLFAAEDGDRYDRIFDEGVSSGKVEIRIRPEGDEQVPSEQREFVAVDAEILLHHVSETLLRFVQCHIYEGRCPWKFLGSQTKAWRFKNWVTDEVAKASPADVAEMVQSIISTQLDQAIVTSLVEHLSLFAHHFLDSHSYNAAKHGMAISGAHERRTLSVDGRTIVDASGPTIAWLSLASMESGESREWRLVSRQIDFEATVALIFAASQMIRAVWFRGRELHCGGPPSPVLALPGVGELFRSLSATDRVAAEWSEPLSGEGETRKIYVKFPSAT